MGHVQDIHAPHHHHFDAVYVGKLELSRLDLRTCLDHRIGASVAVRVQRQRGFSAFQHELRSTDL